MKTRTAWSFGAWLCATVAFTVSAAGPAPPQGAAARGAKVTLRRVQPSDDDRREISLRARLLSLAVERGETPSPFLEPGRFRAVFRAKVTLPVRDRYRFRVDGLGAAKLSWNGAVVLDGRLGGETPLETAKSVRLDKGENELALEYESLEDGDGQVRLYWEPPGAGFEPIPPEMLSWRADDRDIAAGERLRRGHRLFAERACARCHLFEVLRVGESAFAELDVSGSDLRAAGGRFQRDWMSAWLLAPRAFRRAAAMPAFGLSEREADDLAAWLDGLGAPLDFAFPDGAAAEGRERFLELGCIGCHVLPDRSPAAAVLGERLPLQHVGQKWHAGALVDFLQSPERYQPNAHMPDFRLARDEATALAAYVASGSAPPLRATKGDPDRGRKLAQKKHCALCHELDVPVDERVAPNIRNCKPDRGCLADGARRRGDAPDHELSAADREALRAFLPFAELAPFRRAPLDYAQRHLVAQRCTGCHGLDGEPSVWARVARTLAAEAPLPAAQDPVAQGVPSLTWVGGKLQPSWIERFVTGEEKSPRPWLHARMPAFPTRGAAIAQGLVREHGYGAADEPPVPADPAIAAHGKALLEVGSGFGCVQCHALGDRPPEQVFEREGIELYTARRRLRHEYYSRWLLDPPRIHPESRMPRYANDKGKTAFTEILGGDARLQFEAIWQYLGGRR